MGIVYSFETRLLPRDERGRQCIDYTERSTDDPTVDGVTTPYVDTTYCDDQAPDKVKEAIDTFTDAEKRLQKTARRKGDTSNVEQLAPGVYKVYSFPNNNFLGQGIYFNQNKGEISIRGTTTEHYIISDRSQFPDLFEAAEALVAQAQ